MFEEDAGMFKACGSPVRPSKGYNKWCLADDVFRDGQLKKDCQKDMCDACCVSSVIRDNKMYSPNVIDRCHLECARK